MEEEILYVDLLLLYKLWNRNRYSALDLSIINEP